VTYKTCFEFDDRIYWTFIQLVYDISQITVFHWALSTSEHTTLIHYSWSQIKVIDCYIASDLTSQTTRPLPSYGCLSVVAYCIYALPRNGLQLYRQITVTVLIDVECIISISAPFCRSVCSLWCCIDLEWRHFWWLHFVLHIIPCQKRLMDWERAIENVHLCPFDSVQWLPQNDTEMWQFVILLEDVRTSIKPWKKAQFSSIFKIYVADLFIDHGSKMLDFQCDWIRPKTIVLDVVQCSLVGRLFPSSG
jgi:hypothetical protein